MPFTSGSVACAVFRVADSLPENFSETVAKALNRYAFRPISAERGEERASGWVDPDALFDTELRLNRLLLGDYLRLGLRIDKKSPNRAVLDARIHAAVTERLKERDRKRLTADERTAIKSEARNRLLAETSPATVVHEALWNLEAGWLYLSSQATTAINEFLDLFASAFELELIPMLPYTYAETWADSHGLLDALEGLTPGRFTKRPIAIPSQG